MRAVGRVSRAMLEARGVGVRFGGRWVLRGVSARFGGGEVVMLVGANGAGKSTLLRCLSGELGVTEGGVVFGGRGIGEWGRRELARRRAVLPQRSDLRFGFTALQVVLLGRIAHGGSEAENREVAEVVLGLCDCWGFRGRAYTELSGGEQQRVQLARVIAQVYYGGEADAGEGGRFLLLDEPVSALDLSHQYQVLRLLRRLRGELGVGVVCALHDLNLAAQFGERVVVLREGEVVADGGAGEVFTEELVGEVFGVEVRVEEHPEGGGIPLVVPRLGG